MKDNSSPTSRTTRYSMSQETEILKCKMFMLGRDMEVQTRDGESSMLTNKRDKEEKDSTVTSDSISTEHSTSDQDFQ